MKQFLEAGKIVAMQGLKGEVKIQCYCDSVDVLYDIGQVYIDTKNKETLDIEKIRQHKNVAIVKFKGFDKIEDSEKLRNKVIYIHRDMFKLGEGSYFIQDIIGMKVYDIDTNVLYGEVEDILNHGANDIYYIKSKSGKTLLLPIIPSIEVNIDIKNNIIKARPLAGLFEDED
ncbi:MAG: ribosome maturation factor RimM [Oscillospiraceae bacterium]